MIVSLCVKSKYYIGWTMSEAANCASGESYNVDPVTKEGRFDRFYNIDLMGVEFSIFSWAVTECWNHNAHMWLRRSIYFRMNRKINREAALYLTYIISAFWHGFYPFYFPAFTLYAVVTENHKEIYKLCAKYPTLRKFPFMFAL
jgi:hypothetical protein